MSMAQIALAVSIVAIFLLFTVFSCVRSRAFLIELDQGTAALLSDEHGALKFQIDAGRSSVTVTGDVGQEGDAQLAVGTMHITISVVMDWRWNDAVVSSAIGGFAGVFRENGRFALRTCPFRAGWVALDLREYPDSVSVGFDGEGLEPPGAVLESIRCEQRALTVAAAGVVFNLDGVSGGGVRCSAIDEPGVYLTIGSHSHRLIPGQLLEYRGGAVELTSDDSEMSHGVVVEIFHL
jgi:hypothetical protein